MKQFLTCIGVLAIVGITKAQPPANYYKNASGKSCSNLKTAISQIVQVGNKRAYGALFSQYLISDIKPRTVGIADTASANVIWDIYSSKAANEVDPYQYTPGTKQCGTYSGENSCYNREHSVPQSWFDGNTSIPGPATDYLHIYPTDGHVNGKRSNFPYGEVANASYTSLNGSKLGSSAVAGLTGTVFEPINEFKGDVARAFLYFVTCYQDSIAGWSTNVDAKQAFDANSFPSVKVPFLQLMIKWHNQDPVSDKERNRNNASYTFQRNRNPFVDSPQYVNLIWNNTCPGLSTLPAKIVLFTGKINNQFVQLHWKTANEVNIDQYIVERSTNGWEFEPVGTISPNISNNYVFTENASALQGKPVLYRIKIVDNDGTVTYGQVLQISVPVGIGYQIVTNPVHHQLIIRSNNPAAVEQAEVKIVSLVGHVLHKGTYSFQNKQVLVPVQSLCNGTYLVHVTAGQQTWVSKMVVLQ
jgi:endonuclease I